MNAYLINGDQIVWADDAMEAIKLMRELTLDAINTIFNAEYILPETKVFLVQIDDQFVAGEVVQYWTLKPNEIDGEVVLAESTIGEVTRDMENLL